LTQLACRSGVCAGIFFSPLAICASKLRAEGTGVFQITAPAKIVPTAPGSKYPTVTT